MSRATHLTTLEIHELDEACRTFLDAFGETPYLVGSALERGDFRDVDVRLILDDDAYDDLFGGDSPTRKQLWALLGRLGSTYLRDRTGLDVDFQIQRQTDANEAHDADRRIPLGIRSLSSFAGGGDAAP